MMSYNLRVLLTRFRWKTATILASKVSFLSRSSSSHVIIPSKSATEAISCIKTSLENSPKTLIFMGTGQYYAHKTNERVIVINLGTSNSLGTPLEILDAGIPSEDFPKLQKELELLPNCSMLVTGEVDSVYEEPWSFGFTNNPYFSIFSKFGYCLTITDHKSGPLFRIYNGPLSEDIHLRNIQNAQVQLSEEPWEKRRLEIMMKDGEIFTVVEDMRPGGSEDLGQLMVSTEWIVKAAGHLCLLARTVGNSKDAILKLPSPLRSENNPWIKLRNKHWIEQIEHKDA